MAKLLNISQGTYNNWENDRTQPSIEQLIALASYFGVSVDYLICNADDYGLISQEITLSDEQKELIVLFNAMDANTQKALITFLKCNSFRINGLS